MRRACACILRSRERLSEKLCVLVIKITTSPHLITDHGPLKSIHKATIHLNKQGHSFTQPVCPMYMYMNMSNVYTLDAEKLHTAIKDAIIGSLGFQIL